MPLDQNLKLNDDTQDVPPDLVAELGRWHREACSRCRTSAMFYCPYCCIPLGVPEGIHVPRIRLPFGRCDVVFDDAPKKATSIHAKVLAPEQVRLVDLFTGDAHSNRTLSRQCGGEAAMKATDPEGVADPLVTREIPEYEHSTTLVLFPDDESVTFQEVGFSTEEAAAFTLVIIDAPWRRAQTLRKHPRLSALRSVRLTHPPPSRFWRYHSEGEGCVSTVEALAAFAREVASSSRKPPEVMASAEVPLDDPLLFFFARQFAYISEQQRSAGASERPMDASAKQRRSAQVRQRERNKRLRPYDRLQEVLEDDVSTLCHEEVVDTLESRLHAAT